MKASQKEYDISFDNTQDNEMNYWYNINVFDDISEQIETVQRREKIRKNMKIGKFLIQVKFQKTK